MSAIWNFIDSVIIQPTVFLFGAGMNALTMLYNWFLTAMGAIWNFIDTVIIKPIGFVFGLALNAVTTAFDWFTSTVTTIWNFIDSVFITPLVNFGSMVWNGILAMKDWIFGAISETWNFMSTYFLSPLETGIDFLSGIIDDVVSSIEWALDAGSNLWDTATGWIPGFSEGGIATGPSSGYPAMLHGTEAIVPLSGGRSIPVEINGATGGGGNTFNITVNAGGITDRTDKRQLAREIGNMIQQEMSRSIGGTTMQGRY